MATKTFLFVPLFVVEFLALAGLFAVSAQGQSVAFQSAQAMLLCTMGITGLIILNRDTLFPFISTTSRFWRLAPRMKCQASCELHTPQDSKTLKGNLVDCSLTGIGLQLEGQRESIGHVEKGQTVVLSIAGERIEAEVIWDRSTDGQNYAGLKFLDSRDALRVIDVLSRDGSFGDSIQDRVIVLWSKSAFRRSILTLWAMSMGFGMSMQACGVDVHSERSTSFSETNHSSKDPDTDRPSRRAIRARPSAQFGLTGEGRDVTVFINDTCGGCTLAVRPAGGTLVVHPLRDKEKLVNLKDFSGTFALGCDQRSNKTTNSSYPFCWGDDDNTRCDANNAPAGDPVEVSFSCNDGPAPATPPPPPALPSISCGMGEVSMAITGSGIGSREFVFGVEEYAFACNGSPSSYMSKTGGCRMNLCDFRNEHVKAVEEDLWEAMQAKCINADGRQGIVLSNTDEWSGPVFSEIDDAVIEGATKATYRKSPCICCVPPNGTTESEINCNDGIDDDGDQKVDCADGDCRAQEYCSNREHKCKDGIDNDGDGLLDCFDRLDCGHLYECAVETETLCDNGRDDDRDQKIDCADEDCQGQPMCAQFEICDDNFDNDGDGLVDCFDLAECTTHPSCTSQEWNCVDGMDDDGDGDIDCQDQDCQAIPGACVETNCTDMTDDDFDEAVDCADSDCAEDTYCELSGESTCDDYFDNDGDGDMDCYDSDCSGDEACSAYP